MSWRDTYMSFEDYSYWDSLGAKEFTKYHQKSLLLKVAEVYYNRTESHKTYQISSRREIVQLFRNIIKLNWIKILYKGMGGIYKTNWILQGNSRKLT